MKKPYSYRDMSNVTCCEPDCSRLIKQNVVNKCGNRKDLRCHKHYIERKREKQKSRKPGHYYQSTD